MAAPERPHAATQHLQEPLPQHLKVPLPPFMQPHPPACEKPGGKRQPSAKFDFCYDLNEDLERLMSLEDKGGLEPGVWGERGTGCHLGVPEGALQCTMHGESGNVGSGR